MCLGREHQNTDEGNAAQQNQPHAPTTSLQPPQRCPNASFCFHGILRCIERAYQPPGACAANLLDKR